MDRFIYSTYDAGSVAIFDDHVYRKVGETFQKPDRSCKESDIVNIQSLRFNRDDNNSTTGSVHNTWTNVEMAISNLSHLTSRIWKTPVLQDSLITPMTVGEQALDFNLSFTIQADGVARVMIYNSIGSDFVATIKINGRKFDFNLKENAMQADANAYKVLTGDVIEIPNWYSRVIVLPYEYMAE